MKQNQLGNSGTFFWFGVVEDRMDPMKVGRVRVRIFGDHTENKGALPTQHLPWAQCVVPTNANEGATSDLKEGSTVFGIYLDGEEKQSPMVLGCVPGIVSKSGSYQQGFNDPRESVTNSYPGLPTIEDSAFKEPDVREQKSNGSPTTNSYNNGIGTRWASKAKAAFRKIGAVIAGGSSTFDEPNDPYGASYPYNNANESESGHVVELDDTPGKERVHIFHRSGSYIEVHPNGTVVKKSTKDNYEFVSNDEFLSVNGHKIEVIENGSSMRIDNAYEIEVTSGNLTINVLSGNAEVYVNGDVTTQVTGDLTAEIEGNAQATIMKSLTANVAENVVVNCEGNHTTNVIGNWTVNAANISLNSYGTCETNSVGSYGINCDGPYYVIAPRIDLN